MIEAQETEVSFYIIAQFKSLLHEDSLLSPKEYHLLNGFMETARCLFNEAIARCG
jgi:hypothetical protein